MAIARDIMLGALQRRDDTIEKVLCHSGHCILYNFNTRETKWIKTDTEGKIFVFERSKRPSFGFTLMNTKSQQNFSELLSHDVGLQLNFPYLLYKNAKGIYAVWFHEKDDSRKVYKTLTSCISKLQSSKEIGGAVNHDIMNLSSKSNHVKSAHKLSSNSNGEELNGSILNMLKSAESKSKPPKANSSNHNSKRTPNHNSARKNRVNSASSYSDVKSSLLLSASPTATSVANMTAKSSQSSAHNSSNNLSSGAKVPQTGSASSGYGSGAGMDGTSFLNSVKAAKEASTHPSSNQCNSASIGSTANSAFVPFLRSNSATGAIGQQYLQQQHQQQSIMGGILQNGATGCDEKMPPLLQQMFSSQNSASQSRPASHDHTKEQRKLSIELTKEATTVPQFSNIKVDQLFAKDPSNSECSAPNSQSLSQSAEMRSHRDSFAAIGSKPTANATMSSLSGCHGNNNPDLFTTSLNLSQNLFVGANMTGQNLSQNSISGANLSGQLQQESNVFRDVSKELNFAINNHKMPENRDKSVESSNVVGANGDSNSITGSDRVSSSSISIPKPASNNAMSIMTTQRGTSFSYYGDDSSLGSGASSSGGNQGSFGAVIGGSDVCNGIFTATPPVAKHSADDDFAIITEESIQALQLMAPSHFMSDEDEENNSSSSCSDLSVSPAEHEVNNKSLNLNTSGQNCKTTVANGINADAAVNKQEYSDGRCIYTGYNRSASSAARFLSDATSATADDPFSALSMQNGGMANPANGMLTALTSVANNNSSHQGAKLTNGSISSQNSNESTAVNFGSTDVSRLLFPGPLSSTESITRHVGVFQNAMLPNSTLPGSAQGTTEHHSEVLTIDQMQQAMLHLIQNDRSFLQKLYSAYLSSVQSDTTTFGSQISRSK